MKVSNMIIRALTGIIFVAAMVGGILYSFESFILLFFVITGLTVWEFTGLVNQQDGVQVSRIVTTSAALLFFLGFVANLEMQVPALSFVPWLLCMLFLLVAELYRKRPHPLINWAYSLMAQLYIALPFGLLSSLYICKYSSFFFSEWLPGGEQSVIVLAIFIFLWCSDTGAYCTGSLIGKHKLFPRISPAKTWEGSIGGGVLAIAASQVIAFWNPVVSESGVATSFGLTAWEWGGLALVVVVFGTWGDLVESLMKRSLGVKDSGHILPGHGGMLDRFDSSLLAIPAVYIYLITLAVFHL